MVNTPAQQLGPLDSMLGTLGLALFVVRTWATSLEVFLHRDLGERYLGWNAAAVLLLVPLYLLGWERYDPGPMLLFLGAYLFFCFIARMGMVRRRMRGESCHSMYTGWPRFLGPKAKISEIRMKQFVEPPITFLVGWMVRGEFNAPLGTYLMIGAVCLVISVNASETISRMRTLDMNDAVIEQEQTAERFRIMRGDRE